jgi:hypothetical protein
MLLFLLDKTNIPARLPEEKLIKGGRMGVLRINAYCLVTPVFFRRDLQFLPGYSAGFADFAKMALPFCRIYQTVSPVL